MYWMPPPEPPKPVKPEPVTACIAAAENRHGVTKCGRSPEREFVFTDADYAMAHYDRAVSRIGSTALAACPQCIEVRKKELVEEATARAK
jgi:hypothetical protein